MPNSVTATITDVIDSRFELTAGEKERLEGRGATVKENLDGTTTVTWTDTTVIAKPEIHQDGMKPLRLKQKMISSVEI